VEETPKTTVVKETPKKPPNVDDLPPEILAMIFEYVPLGTRRHVLPLVCSKFHDVVRDLDSNVTIHVHEGPHIAGLTERDLCRMMSGHRRRTVSSVYIYGHTKTLPWYFKNAGNVLATVPWVNLKCFSMTGEFPVFDQAIFLDAARRGRFRPLERLVLRLHPWPLSCTVLRRWDLPELRSLELETGFHYRAFLSHQGRRPGPFDHMSRLVRLKLVWSPDIQFSRVGELPFARFVDAILPPSVTELTVETDNVGDFCLTGISGPFPNVRLFRVQYVVLLATELARIAFHLLRAFPSLQELVVYGIFDIAATDFQGRFADVILRDLGNWSFEVTESDEVDDVTRVKVVRFFRPAGHVHLGAVASFEFATPSSSGL
jgi:hypothetical protein